MLRDLGVKSNKALPTHHVDGSAPEDVSGLLTHSDDAISLSAQHIAGARRGGNLSSGLARLGCLRLGRYSQQSLYFRNHAQFSEPVDCHAHSCLDIRRRSGHAQ